MTHVTIERAKLEQALGALRNHSGNYKLNAAESKNQIDVEVYLEQAIAAPVQEPSLLATLKAVQGTLIAANEQGQIADTIWFSKYETLFDFIGAEIDKAEQATPPAAPVQGPAIKQGWDVDTLLDKPAAQRQWVNLTDEEINACDPQEECWGLHEAVRRAEAKLKEKNGWYRQHVTDGSPCWCEPEISYTNPETGASVIVHKEPQ